MELLTKIKELARGKKAAVLTGYADAVKAVATNKKIDPEQVAGILDQAGIDPEQFERDVQRHAERLRLRGVADKQAGAEKVLATAKEKITDMEKKLEAAVAEIREAAAPMHMAVRQAEADINAARFAEDELRRSYPVDGPARVALAEAQRREVTAEAKRREVVAKVRLCEGTIAACEDKPAHHQPDELPNARKRLAGYREELATAEAERTAAVADMNAATARMVQP